MTRFRPAVGVLLTILVIAGLLDALNVGRTASTLVWFVLAVIVVAALVVERHQRR